MRSISCDWPLGSFWHYQNEFISFLKQCQRPHNYCKTWSVRYYIYIWIHILHIMIYWVVNLQGVSRKKPKPCFVAPCTYNVSLLTYQNQPYSSSIIPLLYYTMQKFLPKCELVNNNTSFVTIKSPLNWKFAHCKISQQSGQQLLWNNKHICDTLPQNQEQVLFYINWVIGSIRRARLSASSWLLKSCLYL